MTLLFHDVPSMTTSFWMKLQKYWFLLTKKIPEQLASCQSERPAFQWVPPETISNAHHSIKKKKRSQRNTTCPPRSTSVLTQLSHSEMGLLCWHYRPSSYYYTFTKDLPRPWQMEMVMFGKHEIKASYLKGPQWKELLASN